MTARLLALLLCPALFSCSLWMKLDKSKLEYSDTHVDTDEEFTEDGAPDMPGDLAWEGPCPDEPECWAHHDCEDGDLCTSDYCYMECNACLNTPINGAVVTMEDLWLYEREERSDSPPRLSWTGTEFGVVWGYGTGSGNGEIFFTTVAADGSSFIDDPIRITDNTVDDVRPRMAWTGSRWAVAWVHYFGAGGRVHLTLITPGSLAHTEPAIIHETGGHMGSVDIVMSEDRLGVAYDSSDTGQPTMMFSLLEPDGTPIGTPSMIDRQSTFMLYPSLAWSSTEFGLAWQDERDGDANTDIYFARIDSSGAMIGTPAPIVDTSEMNEAPSLAWSGIGYGVAYHRRTATVSPEIYFMRISPTGSPDGSENRLTFSDEAFNEFPNLTFTGSEYGLLYNSNTELSLIRLSSDGSRITDDAWINTYDHPAEWAGGITWNDSRYAVAWQGAAGEWFNLLEMCPP